MNPPYERNLHRKILVEAITHRTKTGECVCLAPSLYTNYKNDKNMQMLPSSYEIITPSDASKLFNGIQLQDSLLITVWNDKNHISEKEIYEQFVPRGFNIVKKLKFKKSFNDFNILNYTNEKYFVPLKLMTARWDKNKDIIIDKLGLLIDGYTLTGQYYKAIRSKNKDRPCGGIAFKTKNEAMNFINSCNTIFFKFLVKMLHTNSRYILKDYPFMEDYTEPWTDERFYKFFNITEDEQKVIEDTIEKYK